MTDVTYAPSELWCVVFEHVEKRVEVTDVRELDALLPTAHTRLRELVRTLLGWGRRIELRPAAELADFGDHQRWLPTIVVIWPSFVTIA